MNKKTKIYEYIYTAIMKYSNQWGFTFKINMMSGNNDK